MFRKLLNVLLGIALLIGIVLTAKANWRRAALRTEFNRLAGKLGRFEIQNPDKLHLQRIETGDPHQLAWRCYHPPTGKSGYALKAYRAGESRGATYSAGHKEEFRIYATIREENGRIKGCCGVGETGVLEELNQDVSTFLQQHWDLVEFVPVAADEKIVVPKNQLIKLAELRVPDRLVDVFTAEYGEDKELSTSQPLVFYLGQQNSLWP